MKVASTARRIFDHQCKETFATWGNSGIVPYEGIGNQLSRNVRGHPHVASQRWRAAMEYYVGLDVSLKHTSICVVDRSCERASSIQILRRFLTSGQRRRAWYVSASRPDRRLLGYGLSLSGLAYR